MKIGLFDSLEWVFPDSEIERDTRAIALKAARGSYVGFNILVESGKATSLMVQSRGLRNRENVSLTGIEFFKLIDVPVEKNTGLKGFIAEPDDNPSEYTSRLAPFRVYDAMEPMDEKIECEKLVAVYVKIFVPESASPGNYIGKIIIEDQTETLEVSVDLLVFQAVIPRNGNLKVTNWFGIESMPERYNLESLSEDHWTMMRRYAELMLDHRQNMFRVPTSLIKVEKNAQGYKFDFSLVERFINLFLDVGFTYIEGSPIGKRRDYDDEKFWISLEPNLLANSHEGYQFLASFLPKWYDFLKERGLLDNFYQHVGDEPIENSQADYRILSGTIRKFMPDVRLIDAVELWWLGGSVDVWTPQNHYYENNIDEFEKHRILGDEIWFYTCCKPGGKYLNRFLDTPLIRTALLHWGNYLYDLQGYLHWGLNRYRSNQNPFEQSVRHHRKEQSLPAGDSHIVYPGENGPLSSVRFEAMREGIEDFELLKQVEGKKGREEALRLTKLIITSFKDYSEDISLYRKVKQELLESVSQ